MSSVIQNLGNFLLYAIIAIFVENVVFTRGFGVSRLVELMDDPVVDSVILFALLTLIQVISAPLAFYSNRLLAEMEFAYADYFRPLIFIVCAIIAFAVVVLLIRLFSLPNKEDLEKALPVATFNLAVLGPMLITSTQSYTFTQTMGFAVGSGLGYGLATLFLTEGQRKLNTDKIPAPFRGLPINLLYIGIVAMAIYGLTGHMLTI